LKACAWPVLVEAEPFRPVGWWARGAEDDWAAAFARLEAVLASGVVAAVAFVGAAAAVEEVAGISRSGWGREVVRGEGSQTWAPVAHPWRPCSKPANGMLNNSGTGLEFQLISITDRVAYEAAFTMAAPTKNRAVTRCTIVSYTGSESRQQEYIGVTRQIGNMTTDGQWLLKRRRQRIGAWPAWGTSSLFFPFSSLSLSLLIDAAIL
jgi:hypothetical protein